MDIYKGRYKQLLLIPALLWILFLGMVFLHPGLEKGIDLQGGTLIIVRAEAPLSKDSLEQYLQASFELTDLQVSTISSPTGGFGATIQFSQNDSIAEARGLSQQARTLLNTDPNAASAAARDSIALTAAFIGTANTENRSPEELVELATQRVSEAETSLIQSITLGIRETFSLPADTPFQTRSVGPVLGDSFYSSAITVSLAALVLVTIVIFLFFRKLVPSLAVLLAALFDISAALGFMAWFQIPLSLSTIPALLMLVGYSIDTDIMLTTRLLKRGEGSVLDRAQKSLLTGITMTLTTAAALVAMIFFSYFAQITVIFDIAIVLFFGLMGDLVSTWLMNAPILLWYLERKGEEIR